MNFLREHAYDLRHASSKKLQLLALRAGAQPEDVAEAMTEEVAVGDRTTKLLSLVMELVRRHDQIYLGSESHSSEGASGIVAGRACIRSSRRSARRSLRRTTTRHPMPAAIVAVTAAAVDVPLLAI